MKILDYKAILCDIGGVLYSGDKAIAGAIEAVKEIKKHYPIRFLTNTTQKTSEGVVQKLRSLGFDIKKEEVITALDITKMFLQQQQSNAYFLLTDEALTFFDDLQYEKEEYVIVGDAQENFSYNNLNTAFRKLYAGSKLVAIAKNRYFQDKDGLSMDAGCFVAALEYASLQEARILGKPSREFFHLACEDMGVKPSECIMIGDDIEGDVKGAQDAGIKGVLVKTGKFSPKDLERGIEPDLVLDSIADLLAV